MTPSEDELVWPMFTPLALGDGSREELEPWNGFRGEPGTDSFIEDADDDTFEVVRRCEGLYALDPKGSELG